MRQAAGRVLHIKILSESSFINKSKLTPSNAGEYYWQKPIISLI
jgi:hypothetical protein